MGTCEVYCKPQVICKAMYAIHIKRSSTSTIFHGTTAIESIVVVVVMRSLSTQHRICPADLLSISSVIETKIDHGTAKVESPGDDPSTEAGC